MNQEPIDEARISELFRRAERKEQEQALRHAQPILRSTKPRWMRLTVGESLQAERRHKEFWSGVAWIAALTAGTWMAHFGSLKAGEWLFPARPLSVPIPEHKTPYKPILRSGGPVGAGAQATFDAEGRMVRVSL